MVTSGRENKYRMTNKLVLYISLYFQVDTVKSSSDYFKLLGEYVILRHIGKDTRPRQNYPRSSK